MKFKKKELLLGVLLGTGLQLLNNLREHLPDNVDEIKDRARERYDRLGRATNVLRGKEESRRFGKVGVLLIGVGVGVGVGLLIAPTSGEKTRADIADRVSDLGNKVRQQAGRKPPSATGTYGE